MPNKFVQVEVSVPDENGSYTISLTFDESNPVFKTPTLARTIEKNPNDDGNTCTCAPFEFKQVCFCLVLVWDSVALCLCHLDCF
jgi:hypothetical protein